MNQDAFDFSAPLCDPQVEGWSDPPFATGSHSSWTGSRVAVKTWGAKTSAILQLLAGGPKTRQELQGLTGYSINAVCSVVKGLIDRGFVERTGDFDTAVFDSGTTRRERLRIRRR